MAEFSKRSERRYKFPERCRKTFFVLSYAVIAVGNIAFCFYLIWLFAYLKDSGYYWFFAVFAFMPGLLFVRLTVAAFSRDKDAFLNSLLGVQLMVMCLSIILTIQSYYYHLSGDALMIPRWVIMYLEGSIVFFVSGFFIERDCRLEAIIKDKHILSSVLLDSVDIFNLVELLSLNQCVVIGSSVTEAISLVAVIQSFFTLSFLMIGCIYDNERHDRFINWISLIFQDIPFLVTRIVVWAKYNVFSLGFMVKNMFAIAVCCAEIYQGIFGEEDRTRMKNKIPEQHDNNVTTESEIAILQI